ncbi:hypothetical protein BOTNAR_0353g00030 [Botryotinia narcissicola]|uniref:Uncharacterized protein n=1 Tax=Botryotinia narcissicola TaxID=278944 RepID=A0A4Z1HRP6_9HELO|nr:hypothetical protein BOTNAR_0353g00030 [Botryotinia narcissicola]
MIANLEFSQYCVYSQAYRVDDVTLVALVALATLTTKKQKFGFDSWQSSLSITMLGLLIIA